MHIYLQALLSLGLFGVAAILLLVAKSYFEKSCVKLPFEIRIFWTANLFTVAGTVVLIRLFVNAPDGPPYLLGFIPMRVFGIILAVLFGNLFGILAALVYSRSYVTVRRAPLHPTVF